MTKLGILGLFNIILMLVSVLKFIVILLKILKSVSIDFELDWNNSPRNTYIDHIPASELFPYLSKNAIFLILNFNSTNLKPTLLSAIFT